MGVVMEFKHSGLDCQVCDAPFDGAHNGYVGVPKDHPLFGVEYSQESKALNEVLEKMKQQPIPERPSFAIMISLLAGEIKATPETCLNVPGGITYSRDHSPHGKDKSLWWFGFDTLHFDDNPATQCVENVERITRELAEQLSELGKIKV